MLRNEFYRHLKSVIDANQFVEDDIQSLVSIRLPLRLEDVKDLKLCILSLLGQFHVPYINPQDNPLRAGYKIDSHFIDVDKQTIDINPRGKLFARPEIIAEQLINDPNKWQTFLEGLFTQIMNDQHAVNYFVEMIKNDTTFINELRTIITEDILNDQTFISSVINSINTPFNITKLAYTWAGDLPIQLIIGTDGSWRLTGSGAEASINFIGTSTDIKDSGIFYLRSDSAVYAGKKYIRCKGELYNDTEVIISVLPCPQDPNTTKYGTYILTH